MGFTRSTTDISVHQKLDDYPNRDDGLTPEEIKKRYDYPAETLQKDLNKLEEELEKYNAAQSIGADSIHGNDESDANVQAKLMEIYRQLEKVILNQIPDNTITKQKLNSDYSSIIAEKTGDVQLNLNAEKVDGLTGAEIREMKTITGTYIGDGTEVRVIDLGFTPKAILVQKCNPSRGDAYPYEGGLALKDSPLYGRQNTICVGIVENGFQVGYINKDSTGYSVNHSNRNGSVYNYIAWR